MGKHGVCGLFDTLFHALTPIVAGTTGTELLLEDEEQMLQKLVDEDHLDALKCFRHRVCYGNTQHDPQVPGWTANIARNMPSNVAELPCISDEYPSILDAELVAAPEVKRVE